MCVPIPARLDTNSLLFWGDFHIKANIEHAGPEFGGGEGNITSFDGVFGGKVLCIGGENGWKWSICPVTGQFVKVIFFGDVQFDWIYIIRFDGCELSLPRKEGWITLCKITDFVVEAC